jgi:hypothetical protein
MNTEKEGITGLIKLQRKVIKECLKEAPNVREIEKITGEKYPDIKSKPFWQRMEYDIDSNSSIHLKATHLAVLAVSLKIQAIFGSMVVIHIARLESLEKKFKDPIEKELFGLYEVIQKLHEVQQAVEERKLSCVA